MVQSGLVTVSATVLGLRMFNFCAVIDRIIVQSVRVISFERFNPEFLSFLSSLFRVIKHFFNGHNL